MQWQCDNYFFFHLFCSRCQKHSFIPLHTRQRGSQWNNDCTQRRKKQLCAWMSSTGLAALKDKKHLVVNNSIAHYLRIISNHVAGIKAATVVGNGTGQAWCVSHPPPIWRLSITYCKGGLVYCDPFLSPLSRPCCFDDKIIECHS